MDFKWGKLSHVFTKDIEDGAVTAAKLGDDVTTLLTAADASINISGDAAKVSHTGLFAKSPPIAADLVMVDDSADNHSNKKVTLADLTAFVGAMAQLPVDLASSLFFLSGEVDYSTSASKVAVKFSDHSGASALPAKGKLVAAIISNTVANAGGTASVISIAVDSTPTAKMCADVTITVAETVFSNAVHNCMIAMPVSGANAIVDPTSEDIYVVAAADTSRTHAGKIFVLLIFMKTA